MWTRLGGKVNQQRWTDKWTALHLAAMLGNNETVEMLLSAGANSRMEDHLGQTPATVATRFGFPDIATKCEEARAEKFKRERQIKPVENSEYQRDRETKVRPQYEEELKNENSNQTEKDDIPKGSLGLNKKVTREPKSLIKPFGSFLIYPLQ